MEQDKTGNVIVAATKVSSPIPPAEEMERYNNINPEIVTKIMDVYEAYSKHIQHQEQAALDAKIADVKRGQYMAFIIAMGLLFIVAASLYLGNITFAGVSGLAFIAYVLKGFYKH